jgi:hypothetical protein
MGFLMEKNQLTQHFIPAAFSLAILFYGFWNDKCSSTRLP